MTAGQRCPAPGDSTGAALSRNEAIGARTVFVRRLDRGKPGASLQIRADVTVRAPANRIVPAQSGLGNRVCVLC